VTTTLSARARRKLLFSPRLLELAGEPLTYMDVGARGDLDEPWSLMPPGALRVIGFEPDVEECTRLNAAVPAGQGRRYYPAALWSHDTNLNFHINKVPSTSSVFPVNMTSVARFHPQHMEPREAMRIVSSTATTLDAVVVENGLSPDFLKLDTQGAELPILQGAPASLGQLIAVTTETWVAEVYKGQPLAGEILSCMHGAGFSVFDFNLAAAWNGASAGRHGFREKRQLVGLDFLFIRSDLAHLPRAKVIKAAAITDVFGFPGAAIDMLDAYLLSHLRDEAATEARAFIIATNQTGSPTLARLGQIVRRLSGRRESDFARIH
jgi:FkbM family methyltransferase